MYSIWKYGSAEQKDEWLPRLAAGEAIGCFGLTEPDFGSNPAGMRTRATRDGSDWMLTGTKMWITNGSLADIATVWARTEDGIRGFLVPRGTPGFTSSDVPHKLSLRASTTSELTLDEVRLPAAAMLPEARGLRGPLGCLNEARFGIVFGALGAARDCLESDAGLRQDPRPVRPADRGLPADPGQAGRHGGGAVQGAAACAAPGPAEGRGRLRPEQVSAGKLNSTREAITIARTCRTILGASGITLDYSPLRHANNLEAEIHLRGHERGAPALDRAGADGRLGVPVSCHARPASAGGGRLGRGTARLRATGRAQPGVLARERVSTCRPSSACATSRPRCTPRTGWPGRPAGSASR